MPNLDKAYLINFTSFVPLIRSADYCVSVHAPSSIHTFFPRSSLHISIPIHHPLSVSASSNSKSNLLVVRTYLRQLIQISVMGQIVTKESPTEFLPPVQTRGMANLESNLAQQNILNRHQRNFRNDSNGAYQDSTWAMLRVNGFRLFSTLSAPNRFQQNARSRVYSCSTSQG